MKSHWSAPLSESSRVPLWVQIAERLRDGITHGTFSTGDVIPSESELGRVFAVSRATSRGALSELEREGLIVRRRGKGSIVQQKRVDQPASKMRSFSEDMRKRGLTPSYRTLDVGNTPAGMQVAQALEVQANTRVFRSRRLLLADGAPLGFAVSWIPPRLLRNIQPPTAEELSNNSLYDWIHRNCGTTLERAHEYIEAAAATGELAELLSVPAGSPLLIARRQAFDQHDKPAEYTVIYFRPDRYRLELELTR